MLLKRFFIIVFLLTLPVSFALARGTQEAEEDKVTIELFNYVDAAAPEGQIWEEVKAAFLAAHPDIAINEESAYGEPYHQKAKARIAAGDLPDVFYAWPGARTSYFIDNDILENLTPHIDKSKYLSAAVAAQGPKGEIYELPWTVTATSVVYVNTKILREVFGEVKIPRTYEELVAMVKPLKEKGYDTVIMPNEPGWVMNSCLLSTFVGRYGGANWIVETVAGRHKFTDEPFVKALRMVERLYEDGVLPPSSIQTAYGDAPSLFLQEKAPFMIDGNWRANAFIDAPDDFKEIVELTIFPAIPGEKYPDSSSIVPAIGFGMVKGLKGTKRDAALTFIKWMSGYEACKIRFDKMGYLPVFKGEYGEAEDILMRKANAFYTEYPNASGVIDNFIGGTHNDTLNNGLQEIGLGRKTPEQVASEVEAARGK